MQLEALRQEAEFRKCSRDAAYFFSHYWKVWHPKYGTMLFQMRDAQAQTLQHWLNRQQTITLKARQIGFSTLAAAVMFWDVFFHHDWYDIALSKTEREAWKLLKKSKYGYKRLPEWMLARGPREVANTLTKLEFDNDSSIECLPANDPARGETASRIFVDEWAHFEKPEEAWAAIEPAVDIGGSVHALSSANGMGNLFHDMWVKATTGVSTFHPIFFSWRAVPERDDAWYATKKRNMLDWQLHQEYPTTPEEAFIKSGNPVFDVEELHRLDTEDPFTGYLHEVGHKTQEFHPNEGPLQMWEEPQARVRYVIGADVAEGLEHGDYSVAWVIDTLSGRCVAKWRGHIDPDLFGSDVLWHLGWFYNCALIGVEVNGHGFTTLTALNAKNYPNLYYRHTYDERTKKKTRKLGWRTQKNTKPLMIDELARDLRVTRDEDDEIVHEATLRLQDSETIAELTMFVRDPDGKMHGSPFDDQVDALAIANMMRHHASTPEFHEEKHDEWTLDWWVRQADQRDQFQGEWVIGGHSVRSGTVGANSR